MLIMLMYILVVLSTSNTRNKTLMTKIFPHMEQILFPPEWILE